MAREEILKHVYLTYIPSEKFKTSFFSAQMLAPLCRETAGLNALLVNVLNRGTVRCPDLSALGRELDLLYGARLEPVVRKKGENQVFGFIASCVDDRLLPGQQRLVEPLTELLGEMFCAPVTRNGRLNGDYVAGERANLADLIRSDVNDKRTYTARRLLEVMCDDEPYGLNRLGEADAVERISLQKLNTYYQELLPQAPLELFYCGPVPEKRVADAFERAFAALPRQEKAMPLAHAGRRAAPAQPKVVEEVMDVTQGKLGMGFRTDSGDMAATMLMNTLFGGSSSSRLFLNVREKLSLCYYAGSAFHRSKGILTVSSGIECGDYQRVVEEILRQLEELRCGRWEDWEEQGARSSLRNSLRAVEDSAGALEDFFMGQAATGGEETLPGLLAEIERVDKSRICEAAAHVQLDTIYFLKGGEEQA